MALSVHEIFLLDFYDHRPTNYKLSGFQIEEYGADYQEKLTWLHQKGYLTIATPQETLNYLTIPKLKNILRSGGQKLSGNKGVLIKRIIDNIPIAAYQNKMPEIYVLSEIGRESISRYAAYLENKKYYYGFMNSEISDMEKSLQQENDLNSRNVLLALFKKHINHSIDNKEFDDLSSTYYHMYMFMLNHKMHQDALCFLLLARYIELSGLGNNCYVKPYEQLNFIFENKHWEDMDKLITLLEIRDDKFIQLFHKVLSESRLNLPFSYFDDNIMPHIMMNATKGVENLLEFYKSKRNIPQKNNTSYTFWNYSDDNDIQNDNIEHSSEAYTSSKKAASTGCLLPCLLIIILVIFIL